MDIIVPFHIYKHLDPEYQNKQFEARWKADLYELFRHEAALELDRALTKKEIDISPNVLERYRDKLEWLTLELKLVK